MKVWQIVYITFIFKNDKGTELEKTREYTAIADTKEEAKKIFLGENIKFKLIKSIEEDKSNTLGNICPNLIKLRNQMLK